MTDIEIRQLWRSFCMSDVLSRAKLPPGHVITVDRPSGERGIFKNGRKVLAFFRKPVRP